MEQYRNKATPCRNVYALDNQKRIVYSLISENGNKGIPTQAKGYGVATMTVLSRAKEFGFEFWFFAGEKKAPPISRQGLMN